MKKLILNFKSKDIKKIKNPKNFLGGKGANLSEMGRMGLPVPPGFTISTKVCEFFYKDKKKINKNLVNKIRTQKYRKGCKKKIWRFKKSIIVICKIWSKSFYARHDGYNFKLRFKR